MGPNIKRFAALQAAFPEVEFFAIGDDTEQIRKLGQTCKANVLMDVDMGQHRTGVPLDKVEAMYREWNTLPGTATRAACRSARWLPPLWTSRSRRSRPA